MTMLKVEHELTNSLFIGNKNTILVQKVEGYPPRIERRKMRDDDDDDDVSIGFHS